MKDRVRSWFTLFQSRLSRRIVLWVFGSIVLIEGIILIPSVVRRERELLVHTRELATARAAGLLQAAGEPLAAPPTLLAQLAQVQADPKVVGGALYDRQGQLVGTFGDRPQLTWADVQAGQVSRLQRTQRRYDALWFMSPLDGQYTLIMRHDVTLVQQELLAFIGRIAGLVVIISGFVTIATLIILEGLLITPILTLRRDLLRVGPAASSALTTPPEFESWQRPYRDELGDVMAAFEQMYTDVLEAIAQRQAVEADLRLSETKFSRAFRSSPNPMTISTLADGRFIEVNDSFLHTFHYDLAQVTDQTALDLGLWQNPSDRGAMITQIKATGMVRNQEYPFCTMTGQVLTMLYSAERLEINGQDCMLSVYSDISDRKQAEEALQESEARFRTLVEQAVDAFYLTDASARFIDVNQRACEQLGYSRAELLKLTVLDVQQDLTWAEYQTLWQTTDSQTPRTVIGRHRRQDGSIFPVEVHIGQVEVGGQRLLLALARDIRDRQQAQQALKRLAEIGEFSSMIVHEVRNPLTTILLGLSTLKQLKLTPRFQQRLELALSESERLQRLLNEILLYAKGQRLDRDRLDLNLIVAEVIDVLRHSPVAQEHHLAWFSDTRPLPIQGDRDKLIQVMVNLLTNACEASQAGSTITCTMAVDTRKIWAEMKIFNPGEPIPATILAHLTQPFYSTKSNGNGLGLAITKQIIEAHEGQFIITSSAELGGTVVQLKLPLDNSSYPSD